MGLFSKLFGGKSPEAAPQAETPAAPALELAEDAQEAAQQCLRAVDEIASASEERVERAILVSRVAHVRSRSGDEDATLRAAAQVAQAGLQLGNVGWTFDTLTELLERVPDAAGRARARELVQGLATIVEQVDAGGERGALLARLATLHTLVGDDAAASAALAEIDEPFLASESRAGVFELRCRLGRVDPTAERPEGLDDPLARARANKALVAAQVKAGLVDEADELARSIREQPWRDGARVDVAVARAEAGDVEAALAVARGLRDPESQAALLADLAQIMTRSGDYDGARALVEEADELGTRARVWREIALAHARDGDLESTDAALSNMASATVIVECALDVARVPSVRAVRENRDRFLRAALAAVKGVDDPQAARYQRMMFARILARAGNATEALDLAASARDRDDRVIVLDELGEGLALEGHRAELALVLARVQRPFERAAFLIGAARGLLGGDDGEG